MNNFLSAAQEGWDRYQVRAKLLRDNPYASFDHLFWEDLRMMVLAYRLQGYPEHLIQAFIDNHCQALQDMADGWGCGWIAASQGHSRPQGSKLAREVDQPGICETALELISAGEGIHALPAFRLA